MPEATTPTMTTPTTTMPDELGAAPGRPARGCRPVVVAVRAGAGSGAVRGVVARRIGGAVHPQAAVATAGCVRGGVPVPRCPTAAGFAVVLAARTAAAPRCE